MRRLKAKQCWSYSPISIIVRSCSISSFLSAPLTTRFYRWLKFVQILKVSQDRLQQNVHIWKEKKNIASSCKYQHVSDEKKSVNCRWPNFQFPVSCHFESSFAKTLWATNFFESAGGFFAIYLVKTFNIWTSFKHL